MEYKISLKETKSTAALRRVITMARVVSVKFLQRDKERSTLIKR